MGSNPRKAGLPTQARPPTNFQPHYGQKTAIELRKSTNPMESETRKKNYPSSARRTQRWREKQGKRITVYMRPEQGDFADIEAKKRGVSRKKFLQSVLDCGLSQAWKWWPVPMQGGRRR